MSGINFVHQLSYFHGTLDREVNSNICVYGHVGLFIRLNPRSRKMLTIRRPDRQFHSHVAASHMITDATEL